MSVTLQRYSKQFWFPNGALALNIQARVFPENSNAFASLFTDATGTTPLANPTATDGTGTLTFWAESGTYWVHLDTESFLVNVGMSEEQADLSTGVASGGNITVNGLDPTAVDIAPYDGYIANLSDNQSEPTLTRLKSNTVQTVPLDAAGLLRPVTWWLVNSAGSIVQQGNRPDGAQRRTHMVLGVTGFASGAISVAQALPDILAHPIGQFGDLADALSGFNITGNDLSPNGVNLMFNQSVGTVFSRGFNHYDSLGVRTNDPHVSTTLAQTPALFRHVTRTTTTFGAAISIVDVANYDVGGAVTPVPGGANTSTNFRIWLAPTPTAAEQIIVQYGQTTFGSLTSAVNAIGSGQFIPNVVMVETRSILIGYLSVIKSATDLSDPVQALFTPAPKFAAV